MSVSACRPVAGLSEIAGDYDLLLCDVFGTLHDAERTFPEALDALAHFRAGGGAVVLVSNAAEPGRRLSVALAARGIAGVFDGLVSAADVARGVLRERDPDTVLHIGPERDRGLFEGLSPALAGADADLVVCTGYPEDDTDLEAVLGEACRRGTLMLCTNPDTSLRVGGRVLRFAGLVAERYRALGGAVVETGKPGPRIYGAALASARAATGRTFDPARVLGLGDTPALDAGGALEAGFAAAVLAPAGTDLPRFKAAGRGYRLPALAW